LLDQLEVATASEGAPCKPKPLSISTRPGSRPWLSVPEAEEEIVIARANKPIVRVVPVAPPKVLVIAPVSTICPMT